MFINEEFYYKKNGEENNDENNNNNNDSMIEQQEIMNFLVHTADISSLFKRFEISFK